MKKIFVLAVIAISLCASARVEAQIPDQPIVMAWGSTLPLHENICSLETMEDVVINPEFQKILNEICAGGSEVNTRFEPFSVYVAQEQMSDYRLMNLLKEYSGKTDDPCCKEETLKRLAFAIAFKEMLTKDSEEIVIDFIRTDDGGAKTLLMRYDVEMKIYFFSAIDTDRHDMYKDARVITRLM